MTLTVNRDPSQGLVRIGDLELPQFPPFIVSGLVHEDGTVLFGRPEAGKSFVSLALAASMTTGAPFLGTYPVRERHRVAVLSLDMGQAREIKRRQHKAPVPGLDDVLILTRKPGHDPWHWQDLARELRAVGVTFLVIDNLRRIMPRKTSVSDDGNASDVLDNCVEELVRTGIGVLLIAHAGKPGEDGMPRSSPMGTTGIEAWARHIVRVDADKDGYREMVAWGNDLERATLTVPFAITDAGIVPAAPKSTGKQKRSKAREDANAVSARLVVEHCQNRNKDQTAVWLAQHDTRPRRLAKSTYAKELSSGALAKLVSYRDGKWILT